jgi:hypothetical protein
MAPNMLNFYLIWIQFGTEDAHTNLSRDCFEKRHLESREYLEEVCVLSSRMPFLVLLYFTYLTFRMKV